METKTLDIVADNRTHENVVTVPAFDEKIREVNSRIDNVSELTSAVSMDLAHTREFVELMNQHCVEEIYKNRELMHKARKWIIGLGIAAAVYVTSSLVAIIYLLCQVL